MTPHDRRIVHMALKDRDDVVTRSEGDEGRRRIIVEPADDQRAAGGAGVVSRETGPAGRLADRAAQLGAPLAPGAAAPRWWRSWTGSRSSRRTSRRSRALEEGIDRHLLDSLAGLAHPRVAAAGAAVDIGSGAGFPGLALAAARPGMAVTLVESERRKADWLRAGVRRLP